MKILLINPPCGDRTIGLKNLARIEPLGLELIGAGVSSEHEVRLVDMMVRPSDLEATLEEFTPDVAGVTAKIVHVETAIAALRTVRGFAPKCLNVVGGHHPTLCPEDFDDPAVNLIAIGEGIETFAEICAAKADGAASYEHIAGLRIRTEAGLVATKPRALPTNLDHEPRPNRSLVDRYRGDYFYLFEDSVAAIRTSVGCTFPCIFCSCRVYSEATFIPRSPELVFEEIRDLNEEFVMFCDDHSFLDPERMRTLGQMLLDAGVKKRYFAYARSDSIVENRDVFALWAKIGLTLVMTGIEALDESRLRSVGKRIDSDQNEAAIRIMEELGIHLSAGFLVNPDFRKSDFDRIENFLKAHPSILLAEFTPLTPFPGTPLYRKVQDQLLTDDRQVYDLQHFVLETVLPPKKLYRLMLRAYQRVMLRVIRKLGFWRPRVFFSRPILRVLRGALLNFRAFSRAHRDVPRRRALDLCPEPGFETSSEPSIELTYMGWSGFRVTWSDGPQVFIDPPDADAIPSDREVRILLTHGHPEHVHGAASHLKNPHRTSGAVVVASPQVCAYLERHHGRPDDRFYPIRAGEIVELPRLAVKAFSWHHMPLIPPEPRLALAHIARLVQHPSVVFEVIRDAIVGPPSGSMLGFRLTPHIGPRVLLYSEGLHRRTGVAEASAAGRECGADLMIFAVEPEDTAVLPDLVAAVGSRVVIPYEAHRYWREDLDMPQVDLERLAVDLGARGIVARSLDRGERLELSELEIASRTDFRANVKRRPEMRTHPSFVSH
ncbi:MAG: cobalamin-dependent protein [Deltaproteobacteria bacterium]|nr:cobalamin-dependent protein [Deltaproteobacteria bacterium]